MVGYVPQELILFHDTIFANIALGDKAVGEREVEKALRDAGAWDFVMDQPHGWHTIVGEKGGKLSGGQRQRIALARALVGEPALLVLDEVSSALDPTTEADICERMHSLRDKMTILAITHRPAWIDIADQIYRLEDRKLEIVKPGDAQISTISDVRH